MLPPRDEYQARLDARRAEVARLGRRDRALSRARTAVFVAGATVVWFGLGPRPLTAAVAAAAFIALVVLHDRALMRRRRVERAVELYQRALERLDGKWAGRAPPELRGDRFADPAHPYARDLDLFGAGSLFELLCTARTRGGEQKLADWLRAPAAPDVIRARQAAVEELRARVDLREELAILGEGARASLDPEGIAAWGAERSAPATWFRLIAPPIALFSVGAVTWWAIGLSYWPAAAAAALIFILHRSMSARVARLLAAVERPGHDLSTLALIFARLEREPLASPRLAELKAGLSTAGGEAAAGAAGSAADQRRPNASRQIARLGRLVNLFLAVKNQFFLPIGLLLLWAPQLALAIDAWRARSGADIARWLDAAGELEALCALAGYAYEHPEHPFPQITDERAALFDGAELGHPLLPPATCVRNDVRLGGELRLLLVSGSNMSGKSTLLRTVGTNAVLALMGAPVCARRLTLSVLALGATLRVEDSLQEGASRFYAEITRLRQLVDLAEGERPLLFLLDEILAGTNSHDRRVGAEALVRGLVDRGAVGLVTTHDLALADVADSLGARAANVHFEDHLDGGRLVFDYRMRPGVVRKSNAIELMRAVGLKV
ncbi:MAG TPA: DNA mismatch repair protein MutS [Polyangia bacterium]|nr:DNA mismatch repair protein MutS [Polyangia bacterium]